jgi:hypothetical protein
MTPARRTWALGLAAALAAALWTPACVRPSDESAIRALLDDCAKRAEKNDIAGLRPLFAPDYRDFEGRDAEGTMRLVSQRLDRTRGVVIHLLGARVGEISREGTAAVECEVALSHGAAEVLRKLIRYAGEYYRFEVEVRKTGPGAWRLTRASWRSIDLGELFPESLKVLKELFPGF